ncbi:F-box protein [Platanthera guangdongensis]|uniref:F-box protein n=1 Tax=Platanthera guangdongensis TaxID=2320717 RepID=A0ABR2MY72_9ASPA
MQTDWGVTKSGISSGGLSNGAVSRSREANGCAAIPAYSSDLLSSSSSSPSGVNCIEHRVTRMDTLAGVAIKYGVEVADIRRLNGLVTDLQMFAHKTLQIPLPGKHPPSVVMSNGSTQNGEKTPPRHPHDDILGSMQSLKLKPPSLRVSPAMCSLRSYYGLAQPNRRLSPEGTEMTIYKAGKPFLSDDQTLPQSPISDPFHSRHRKSRSLVNVIALENGETTEESDKSIRRRQKADTEPSPWPPEMLIKEEVTLGTSSGRAGKGLAFRSKPGSRADQDAPRENAASGVDAPLMDAFVSVRKSSSASNLSESENSSSIWPTSRWSLKPDVIAWPLLDALPKPVNGRRNKAALD